MPEKKLNYFTLIQNFLSIGDWLKEVDGADITWDNLDEVLAELQVRRKFNCQITLNSILMFQ